MDNVISHGVDLVDCKRLAEAIEQHGDRFLHRVYTPLELGYCIGKKRQIEHLAGRFAAKEAVLKVLGTGWRDGIAWARTTGSQVSGRLRSLAGANALLRLPIGRGTFDAGSEVTAILTEQPEVENAR